MIIQYFGQSCFKLSGKDTAGENVDVVTDPFTKDYGLKVPNVSAHILTVSHQHPDHNNTDSVKGDPYVIDVPGEYDIKDVFVQGIASYHDDKEGKERGDNIIFRMQIDDMSVVHLGDLGHVLTSDQLEALEGTDVLLVPIGGNGYTINAERAVEVVNQLEPRIIVPMHYDLPGLKVDLDGVDTFIKKIGISPTTEDKLRIMRKDLPSEDMEVVVLNLTS